MFRRIKIDTTDYRIVFRLLISEYLTFALIIQNAKLEYGLTLRSASKNLEQYSVRFSREIGSLFHRNELFYLIERCQGKNKHFSITFMHLNRY